MISSINRQGLQSVDSFVNERFFCFKPRFLANGHGQPSGRPRTPTPQNCERDALDCRSSKQPTPAETSEHDAEATRHRTVRRHAVPT